MSASQALAPRHRAYGRGAVLRHMLHKAIIHIDPAEDEIPPDLAEITG